jgi:hypothetical protein
MHPVCPQIAGESRVNSGLRAIFLTLLVVRMIYKSNTHPCEIGRFQGTMSFLNLGIILVGFFVLYKFVIPRLFPEVVTGQTKLKADSDIAGPLGSAGTGQYTVQHSMNLFGGKSSEQRSQLRARRRPGAMDGSV